MNNYNSKFKKKLINNYNSLSIYNNDGNLHIKNYEINKIEYILSQLENKENKIYPDINYLGQ